MRNSGCLQHLASAVTVRIRSAERGERQGQQKDEVWPFARRSLTHRFQNTAFGLPTKLLRLLIAGFFEIEATPVRNQRRVGRDATSHNDDRWYRINLQCTNGRPASANVYRLSSAVRSDSAQTLVTPHKRLRHRGRSAARPTIRLGRTVPPFAQQETLHPKWR
jgi:hypothetical protein